MNISIYITHAELLMLTTQIDPVALAQALIRRPSVTPADEGAMDVLCSALKTIGFTLTRMRSGQAPDGPIENLFAQRGDGSGPHFAFAGHTDVVPEGSGWTREPFSAVLIDNMLYGRGAVDMKGAIAAFVSAASKISQTRGTISLMITGDEEGTATHGTVEILRWMTENNQRPDLCLVGEPTSEHKLGDNIKIGRRGSVNIWITVNGSQGHVAYPHLADNPITRLMTIITRLKAHRLDDGNDWFSPSNLEVTDLTVNNPATNIIPSAASARLNIRFNDMHQGPKLVAWVERVVQQEAPDALVTAKISGEAFLTPPGAFSTLVTDAIFAETGVTSRLSTTGGTSDARFIRQLCPVVEFGLPNATMHKADEAAHVDDIYLLTKIYERILLSVLNAH